MLIHRLITMAILVTLLASIVIAQDIIPITYQGKLTDSSGEPVSDGTYDFEVSLFPDSIGGVLFFADSLFDVQVSLGFFAIEFNPELDQLQPEMWIEINVEGETLSPRHKVTRAPISALTSRVNGDILTAPGIIEIHPPDPCDPSPCPQSVVLQAAPDTASIILKNGDDTDSISFDVHTGPRNVGMTFETMPLVGHYYTALDINADSSIAGIEIQNTHPTGEAGSSTEITTTTLSADLSLEHSPAPGVDRTALRLTADAKESAIRMGFAVEVDETTHVAPLLAIKGDVGGESFINMLNPQPFPPGSISAMRLSNGNGSGANIEMFDPDPDGSEPIPFIEMQVNDGGGSMAMYNPQPDPPGVAFPLIEIQTYPEGGVFNMYGLRETPLMVHMSAGDDGGSLTLYDDSGKYMKAEMSDATGVGALQMFDSADQVAAEMNTDGEVIAEHGKFGPDNANNGTATFMAGTNNTMSANYSQLFAINSSLTQDSTFNVNMPHILFGDQTNGYEFPTADGSAGQVLSTDGAGKLAWANPTVMANSRIEELLNRIEQLEARIAELEAEK